MPTNYRKIYEECVEKSKTEIEIEMQTIIRENLQLETDIRRGEDAKEDLCRNRRRMMELTKTYSEMEEI